MTEAHINTLWTPGESLEVTPVKPSPDEFRARFTNKVLRENGKHWVASLEGSLSALLPPEQTPTAVVFLDMDDFLCNLGGALRELQDPHEARPEYFTHDYGYGMFFDDGDDNIKHPLIRLVKNHDAPGIGAKPTRDIEIIRSIGQSWRSAGAYVAFITSAIPGAELSHVDFLGKHFKQACDGIVITSGDYRLVDKGKAAVEVLDFLSVKANTPVIHIDDIDRNTKKIRAALESYSQPLEVATFQHVFAHPSHLGIDEGSQHGATPLETVMLANDFLTERLGRTLHVPLPYFLAELAAFRSTAE